MSSLKRGVAKQRGFTLIELVMVMLIIGILAAVAVPKFSSSGFDSRELYDQVVSNLRYAQKTAIAQRRFVCVALSSGSMTLTYDTTAPSTAHTAATCPGADLTSPAGKIPFTLTAPSGVTLGGSAAVNFNAQGKPDAVKSITVSGFPTAITVEAETGYVH